MDNKEKAKPMGQVIQIDEARIRDHLGEMVRGTVEGTLNAMLDAEADQLCGAGRYDRTEGRKDTRAESYKRSLDTKAGSVKLKIPKLRRQTFETAIIERYQRRESSVWRFTGKEIDPETGLQYFGARYQDARTSQWISSDPAGPELMVPLNDKGGLRSGYSVVEALNWYAYASNRPVTNIDPTGLDDITLGVSFDVAGGGNDLRPAGLAGALGIVVDTDDPLESGIYFSGGASYGGGAAVGAGLGWYPGGIEGESVNMSATIPLSASTAGVTLETSVDTDTGKVGYAGAISLGVGLTATKTTTIKLITAREVISFFEKAGENLDKNSQTPLPYKW